MGPYNGHQDPDEQGPGESELPLPGDDFVGPRGPPPLCVPSRTFCLSQYWERYNDGISLKLGGAVQAQDALNWVGC